MFSELARTVAAGQELAPEGMSGLVDALGDAAQPVLSASKKQTPFSLSFAKPFKDRFRVAVRRFSTKVVPW